MKRLGPTLFVLLAGASFGIQPATANSEYVVPVTTMTGPSTFVTSGVVVDQKWVLTTGSDVEGVLASDLMADGIQVTCMLFPDGFSSGILSGGSGAPTANLALLRLSEPTDSPVMPLPQNNGDQFAGDIGMLAWYLNSTSSDVYDIPIITNAELASRMSSIAGATITPENIGVYDGAAPTVESGGLFVDGNLVGIASWWVESGGNQLSSYPYVYTRVSYHLDWIQGTISSGGVQYVNTNPSSSDTVELGGGTMCGLRIAGTAPDGWMYVNVFDGILDVLDTVQIDPYGSLGLSGWPGSGSRLQCPSLTIADQGQVIAWTRDPLYAADDEIQCNELTVEPGGRLIVAGKTNLDLQCDSAVFDGELQLQGATRTIMTIADPAVENTGRIEIGRLAENLRDAELSMTANLRNEAGAVYNGVDFEHVGDGGLFLADECKLVVGELNNPVQGYIRTEGNPAWPADTSDVPDSVIDIGGTTMLNSGWFEVMSGITDVRGCVLNFGPGQITIRPGAVLWVDCFYGNDLSVIGTYIENGSGPVPPPAPDGPVAETVLVVEGDLDLQHGSELQMEGGTVVMRGAGSRLIVQDQASVDLKQGTLRIEGLPVFVEAFSPDEGPVVYPASVSAIGTIYVAEGAGMLVDDQFPNGGESPNVVYAKHVIVQSGGMLNLGGVRMYVGTIDVEPGGVIDNGEVIQAEFLCSEDLDGDGAIGFTDLTQLLGAWGPCDGCPEDFDGDGAVGFTDLTQLLGAWGPCATP